MLFPKSQAEITSAIFFGYVKSRVQSDEFYKCPANIKAMEKLLAWTDKEMIDVFLKSLLHPDVCCDFIRTQLPRLTEEEQRLATGKSRDEWLAMPWNFAYGERS